MSKKVGLIIGAIIIVAALVGLYIVYSGQAGEREEWQEKLDRTETLLPTLTTQKRTMEDQLTQAQSSLNTSLAQFPRLVKSIEYDDDLFAIADASKVDITRLTASLPTDRKIGAVTYSVSTFALDVSGDIADILDFINAISTGDDFQLPWSAEVTGITITIGDEETTATINLNIYGYKG